MLNRLISLSVFIALFLVLALALPKASHAADYSPGDACSSSGAFHQTNDTDGMDFLICDGSNWQSTMYFRSGGGLSISSLSGQPAPQYSSAGGGSSVWLSSGSDVYYSSGNVGIGIDNPTTTLFLEDSTADQNYMLTIKNDGDDGDFMEFINDLGEDVMQFRQDGDGSPVLRVHTPNAAHNASIRVEHNSGTSANGPRIVLRQQGPGGNEWHIISTGSGNGPGAGALEFWEATGTGTALVISPVGNIGIGDNTPDVELDVVGDIDYTGVITDVSDRRHKDNITPLENSLEGLLTLNGYSFTMKDDESGKREYGVIAQEVEPVFPELVVTKSDGLKTMNYIGLIAPLLEATKAQQALIEEQRQTIDQLSARIDALENTASSNIEDSGEQ